MSGDGLEPLVGYLFLLCFFSVSLPFWRLLPRRLGGIAKAPKRPLSSTLGLNWASPGCNDGERGLNDEHWLEHEINPIRDLHLDPIFLCEVAGRMKMDI
ncbi:hypothetical protein J3E69DRAFT_310007 [Trichoderma sp. SZMC 28015]